MVKRWIWQIVIWSAALELDRTGRPQGVCSGFNSVLMQTLNADPSLLDISDSNTVLCQSFLSLKSQKTALRYCLLFTPTHTHTRFSLYTLCLSHTYSLRSHQSLRTRASNQKVWEKQNKRGEGALKPGLWVWRKVIYSLAWFIIAFMGFGGTSLCKASL